MTAALTIISVMALTVVAVIGLATLCVFAMNVIDWAINTYTRRGKGAESA